MHSIFNHDYNQKKPPTPLRNQQYDANPHLQNSTQYTTTNQTSKLSMKQLYKNQLDTFMQEKQKQKRLEKQLLLREKEQYRQKVRVGQQNEKMKDLAYKNYYKLLMDSQDHNKQLYVSPYEMRDKLKESHIQNSIDQQMQKSQNFQYEKRARQVERKNQYRQELTKQIEERKKFQDMKKSNLIEENQLYRQQAKGPQEIESYQRERKKEEMEIYRHDLDKIMQDKLSQSRKNNQTNYESKPQFSEHYHNPLINPLPYNIQNPYILKQMQKLSTPNMRSEYQLQDQQNSYQYQERPRNQSSYFAKQGNILLK